MQDIYKELQNNQLSIRNELTLYMMKHGHTYKSISKDIKVTPRTLSLFLAGRSNLAFKVLTKITYFLESKSNSLNSHESSSIS